MAIILPERFDKLITGEYRALVDNAIVTYGQILKENKLPFFEEYTDHGITHIQNVISTADSLIDAESFSFLNEKDIAVLTLSILLHDLGMHLNATGFNKLLSGEYDKYNIKSFAGATWKEEWKSFFQEFKRYNDEQLIDILGHTNIAFDEPTLDKLDDNARRIFGEFLRKMHPRLAHEIAIGGYPSDVGTENIQIPFQSHLRRIIDLAGLVARSHGMSLRSTFDYLEENYQDAWRSPLDVKVIYLMVLLRIADYIQINSDRASKIILRSKRLGSPISKQEWEKHGAVIDVRANTSDPEKIYVVAEPSSSKIFLELEKLFADIQKEFDTSWAILGEVYGNEAALRNLKIKYRRIRSTLDNKALFSKKIKYLPEKVVFDADPELLKLLIGPLYGEDPKYGVRELLQNAVDAVKERKYLYKEDKSISIRIEENTHGHFSLIIKDEGVGMSQDTLINYFFRAGASFRKSMFWKKNFVNAEGSQIQKTGRFGVGVLAIFLLGDDFELYTKYNSANAQGYHCKASLSSKQIEIEKVNCNVGTEIIISLKDDVQNIIWKILKDHEKGNSVPLFDWFTWYKMSEPLININLPKQLIKIFRVNSKTISSEASTPSLGWYKFATKDYQMIHWTIPSEEIFQGEIICNGFSIKRKYQVFDETYKWSKPRVSIFDNNGSLPLSLNRDYIEDDKLPFENELLDAISHEVIAALLDVDFVKKGAYYTPQPKIISFGAKSIDISRFIVVSGEKYTLLDPLIFLALGIRTFYQLWIKASINLADNIFSYPSSFYQASILSSEPNYFYKNKMDPYYHDEGRLDHWFSIGSEPSFKRIDTLTRIYLPKSKYDYLIEPTKNRLRSSYLKSVNKKAFDANWVMIDKQGDQAKSTIHKPNLNTNSLTDSYNLVIEHFFEDQRAGNSFFINYWLKVFGTEWLIPIDKISRKKI